MKTAIVKIKGVSPYQQGRYHATPKNDSETHDELERRSWQERVHADEDGNVFIPPQGIKNCIANAAQRLSISIPGKGQSKYTKHFNSGIMVLEPAFIGCKKSEAEKMAVFGAADGKTGGKKRVMKYFPTFRDWRAELQVLILDEIINDEVFERVIVEAGKFIGLGVFRPESGGYYGRFSVENIQMTDTK